MLVDNDLFLSKLTLMFDKSRSKGHVDLCMKRYDGRTKPIPKPRKNVKQKGKKLFVSENIISSTLNILPLNFYLSNNIESFGTTLNVK